MMLAGLALGVLASAFFAFSLYLLNKRTTKIMADLAPLTLAVQAETTVVASAITLLQQLASQISAASTDPVAIQALATQLNNSAASLAAAIQQNTPAAPAAPAAPVAAPVAAAPAPIVTPDPADPTPST